MKPKMILFDHGGTLIYQENYSLTRCHTAFYPYIIKNPHNVSPEQIDSFIRMTDIKTLRDKFLGTEPHFLLNYVLEYFELELSISVEAAERLMFDNLSDVKPTPYSSEMLHELQSKGVRTGVISNMCWASSAMSERMHNVFPTHKFEFVITTSEYLFRKPEKKIFEIALSKADLMPHEVCYCGNNIGIDLIGAHQVGIIPIFYDDRAVASAIHKKNDETKTDFSFITINSWKSLTEKLDRL